MSPGVDKVIVIGLFPLIGGIAFVLYGLLNHGWPGLLAGLGAAVVLFKAFALYGNLRVGTFYARSKARLQRRAEALLGAACTLVKVDQLESPAKPSPAEEADPAYYPRRLALTLRVAPAASGAEWQLEGLQLETKFDPDLLNDQEDAVHAGWGLQQLGSATITAPPSSAKGIAITGAQLVEFKVALGAKVREVQISYYTQPLQVLTVPAVVVSTVASLPS